MNFIYVIHLLFLNHLTDLITHSRLNMSNRSSSENSGGEKKQKRAPAWIIDCALFCFFFPPLFSLLLLLLMLSLLCVIRSVRWFQYNKSMT